MARWHRRLALFVAAWLVLLALSGILINHANDLGLDRRPLSASLQRVVYGIEDNGTNHCGKIEREGVDCGSIFAQLELPTGSLLLSQDNLFLLDEGGQLVEKLLTSHLGLGRLQAGFRNGPRVYLRDAQFTVLTDAELVESVVLDPTAAASLEGRNWQTRDETASFISWERFLLDLHAARFLGPFAKWINDLMAGFILVLALSGVWLYRLKGKGNGNGKADGSDNGSGNGNGNGNGQARDGTGNTNPDGPPADAPSPEG